jgi:predicted RNase H-like HicB family nuclease
VAKLRFTVVIEQDEDGKYIGTAPDLKGCYSYGDTLDELMKNIKEAIHAHLEVLKAEKKKLPIPRFSGIQEVELEV